MTSSKTSLLNFENYSNDYDLLLKYSPPYQELTQSVLETVGKLYQREEVFTVLDIGGGTGNISKIIQDHFPNVQIHLLEPSIEMLETAKLKLDAERTLYDNVPFQDWDSQEKYDLIICIHCLYLMNDSIKQIPVFKKYMKSSSYLLMCDIGQEIKVGKWLWHLFNVNRKKHGWLKALKIILSGKDAKKSNLEIQKKQRKGVIWKHSLKEFESWFAEYYKILKAKSCYLGCSNYLLCQMRDYEMKLSKE